MATLWRYSKDGEILGPVPGNELKQLAAEGSLQRTDLVQKDGTDGWSPAGSVRGLFPAAEIDTTPEQGMMFVEVAAAPPPVPMRHVKPSGADSLLDTIGNAGQAVASIVFFFISLVAFGFGVVAGLDLLLLKSVSGNTVAEIFYQRMGASVLAVMWFAFLTVVLLSSIAYWLRRIARTLERARP